MAPFRRSPVTGYFKLLSAFLIICFYLLHSSLKAPDLDETLMHPKVQNPPIQFTQWKNGTSNADQEKVGRIVDAMRHTFRGYQNKAWGYDDIKPVSGKGENTHNGWGAFIVDSSTTLALMGMWTELSACVEHIVTIDFTTAEGLVDPYTTTVKYLGGLTSLVEMSDAGQIPDSVLTKAHREQILAQAVTLAQKLVPGFDSPTGMMWPRVDFAQDKGVRAADSNHEKDRDKPHSEAPTIAPARAGTNILEYQTLAKLTGNASFVENATRAWAPLVWPKKAERFRGLVDGPTNILTGASVSRQAHWDGGHNSFYEYLLKATMLIPPSRQTAQYQTRFLHAAASLRAHLASRSDHLTAQRTHLPQHLFLGKRLGDDFVNEQSHLACAAPGSLLLASAHTLHPSLRPLALALLESCHHLQAATRTGLTPELIGWSPHPLAPGNGTQGPQTARQRRELATLGFWVEDPRGRGRPEYFESLFVAWRVTGEQRYRDWAWEAWEAVERWCRTRHGYAGVADVMEAPSEAAGPGETVPSPPAEGARREDEADDEDRVESTAQTVHPVERREAGGKLAVELRDEQAGSFAAETLKYLFLIFADTRVGSLNEWVYSAEGHPFKRVH